MQKKKTELRKAPQKIQPLTLETAFAIVFMYG